MSLRTLRLTCVCVAFTFANAFVLGADELGNERYRMKSIAKTVSDEIEKRYYDPNLKGLNWKGLLEETKQKIDNAKNVPEMLTAIYVMVDKLKDSHTHFLPPSVNVKLKYGFEAKPIGDDIRIYRVRAQFTGGDGRIQDRRQDYRYERPYRGTIQLR
jgi:hypothetical protein